MEKAQRNMPAMESRTKRRHELTNTTDASKGKAPAKKKSKNAARVLKKKLNWVSEFLLRETIKDDEGGRLLEVLLLEMESSPDKSSDYGR
ncbi:hypothetical protein LguiA_007268 [Lonicera macranthoides]